MLIVGGGKRQTTCEPERKCETVWDRNKSSCEVTSVLPQHTITNSTLRAEVCNTLHGRSTARNTQKKIQQWGLYCATKKSKSVQSCSNKADCPFKHHLSQFPAGSVSSTETLCDLIFSHLRVQTAHWGHDPLRKILPRPSFKKWKSITVMNPQQAHSMDV